MKPYLLIAALLCVPPAGPGLSKGNDEALQFGPFEVPRSRTWQTTLTAPEEAVRGFPLILNLRLTNAASSSTGGSVLDLGRGGTGDRLDFFFWDKGEDAFYVRRYGSEEARMATGLPSAYSQAGESASVWFDMVQILNRRFGGRAVTARYPEGIERDVADPRDMTLPGEWQLVVRRSGKPWTAGPVKLWVREPNAAERDFLKQVSPMLVLEGRQASWFPDLVVTPKALPVSDGLPASTRRIVELVELLRAAVRSEGDGLQALSAKAKFDWGYLQDLVEQIRYECLLSMPDESKAQEVESTLNRPDRERIQRGGGIVSQLRVIRDRDAYAYR